MKYVCPYKTQSIRPPYNLRQIHQIKLILHMLTHIKKELLEKVKTILNRDLPSFPL